MVPSSQQNGLRHFFSAGIAAAIATVGVGGLRALGLLEPFELKVYDQWLRWRPPAAAAERILIVAVGEEDIQNLKQYPVPDAVLIRAVAELQKHRPKVIGIDIFRDFPVPDRFEPPTAVLPSLGRAMMTQPNTVIVCKVGQGNEPDIAPPAGLLPHQVGFADIPIDHDGVVRRAILATTPAANARCHAPQSFALAVASVFLGTAPQSRAHNTLQLGTARFRALTPNWGGYTNLDAAGFQILINYVNRPQAYETVSLTDVLTERVLPSQVRDRAVLIGVTASSSNDKFLTPLAQNDQGNRLTAGVMVQAAILDDLLATAIENRPPLWTWPQGAIALWILGWSFVGALIVLKGSRWLVLPLFVTAGASLGGFTFLLFLQAGWIPVVAPAVGFVSAGVLMLAYRAFGTATRQVQSTAMPNAISTTPLKLISDVPSSAPHTSLESGMAPLVTTENNTDVLQPETSIPFTPIEVPPVTTGNRPEPLPTVVTSGETRLSTAVDEAATITTELPNLPSTPTGAAEMETFLAVDPTDPKRGTTTIEGVTATPETQVPLTAPDLPETQVTLPEAEPAASTVAPQNSANAAPVRLDPDMVETQLGIKPTQTPPTPLAAAPPSTCPSPAPRTKTTLITDLEAAATEPLPQTLGGRYRVVRQLGEGGFGRTFLAVDQHLPNHPLCVIKQLVPSRNDEQFLAIARRLFRREAEALAQLGQHDRIPRLLAYFEEDGVFYLTQEYVEGESLKEEFAKKITLSQAEAIAILKSILELLEYVHQLGVIHRDIKPANIMRRRSDQKLFLIDFGAVRHVQPEDLQKHGKYTISIGTRGYAPSEQMAGRPVIASDLYSLGMVIIEGLTGLAPMDLPSHPVTGDVVWEPAQYLSPAFVAILNRMTKYNVRDRYQRAAEVLAALAAAGF